MRAFSADSDEIAQELEGVCSRLRQLLNEADGYMQDDSGQKAISIVSELVEETTVTAGCIRSLAGRIQKSAELLEESDTLL